MKHSLLLTALCIAVLPQCATDSGGPRGNFSVKVVPFFGEKVNVYIAAYTRDAAGKPGTDLSAHRVTGDGITGFVLPMGKVYGVRAYADLDGDGHAGPNDPTASLEGLKPVADHTFQQDPVILTLPGGGGVSTDWPQAKGTPAGQGGSGANGGASPSGPVSGLPIPPPPSPSPSLPVPPPPQ